METAADSHLLITIARRMGSGGGEIGMALAERLDCRFLDRALLTEAAERVHLDPGELDCKDERHLGFLERSTMRYALGLPGAIYGPHPVHAADDFELFSVQKEIIKEAAARGPAVIVGRAAHWVLRDEPGLFSIYLHAPFDVRVRRIQRLYSLPTTEEARHLIEECDAARNRFSRWATGHTSGDSASYHLCLDTFRVGIQNAIELILSAVACARQGLSSEKEDF